MKIFKMILVLVVTINAHSVFFKSWSIGGGTVSEQIGQVQEDLDGETNGLEFNPFARITTISDSFFGHDLISEFGITTPRSSRDSDVTTMNYWLNFLFSKDYGFIRPQYGAGMYFTRLSMDGTPQDLSNGGDPQTFQTPNGSAIAGNITLILGLDIDLPQELYFNLQAMVLNPEDSVERAFNILASINYDLGM